MLRILFNKFSKKVAFRPIPKTSYGVYQTSADFGSSFIVVKTYNTDVDGNWVDYDDFSNQTFHGPFFTIEEAQQWMDESPSDMDVKEWEVYVLNNVR